MKLFNLWRLKHFYDMRCRRRLSSLWLVPALVFIFIFAINLQQWEKKMLKEDLVISLIKLFKRMSIVQNVEKRKCDSDYFYSLFILRQGHETFQHDFVIEFKPTLSQSFLQFLRECLVHKCVRPITYVFK